MTLPPQNVLLYSDSKRDNEKIDNHHLFLPINRPVENTLLPSSMHQPNATPRSSDLHPKGDATIFLKKKNIIKQIRDTTLLA